jgi:hypothetical protein
MSSVVNNVFHPADRGASKPAVIMSNRGLQVSGRRAAKASSVISMIMVMVSGSLAAALLRGSLENGGQGIAAAILALITLFVSLSSFDTSARRFYRQAITMLGAISFLILLERAPHPTAERGVEFLLMMLGIAALALRWQRILAASIGYQDKLDAMLASHAARLQHTTAAPDEHAVIATIMWRGVQNGWNWGDDPRPEGRRRQLGKRTGQRPPRARSRRAA